MKQVYRTLLIEAKNSIYSDSSYAEELINIVLLEAAKEITSEEDTEIEPLPKITKNPSPETVKKFRSAMDAKIKRNIKYLEQISNSHKTYEQMKKGLPGLKVHTYLKEARQAMLTAMQLLIEKYEKTDKLENSDVDELLKIPAIAKRLGESKHQAFRHAKEALYSLVKNMDK